MPSVPFENMPQTVNIQVSFVVSNLANIQDPLVVNASGLMQAFPVLVQEVVRNSTSLLEDSKRRMQRKETHPRGRLLRTSAIPGTARIESIEEYLCPSNALPGLTCHVSNATFAFIATPDENMDDIRLEATEAAQAAVDDGSFNALLLRVVPDTPLYIGIMTSQEDIPPFYSVESPTTIDRCNENEANTCVTCLADGCTWSNNHNICSSNGCNIFAKRDCVSYNEEVSDSSIQEICATLTASFAGENVTEDDSIYSPFWNVSSQNATMISDDDNMTEAFPLDPTSSVDPNATLITDTTLEDNEEDTNATAVAITEDEEETSVPSSTNKATCFPFALFVSTAIMQYLVVKQIQ